MVSLYPEVDFLFLDGTIEPTFAFTAVQNGCVSKAHYHNAYWRFDFDIDGFPQDVLDRFLFFIFWAGWDTVGTSSASQEILFVGYVVARARQDHGPRLHHRSRARRWNR